MRHRPSSGANPVTVVFITSRGAVPAREIQQAIAHVARALRRGKELRRLYLLDERQSELALEEGDLLPQRPRSHDPADEVRWSLADEARFVELGWKDVAPAAAADEDLASAVGGALDEEGLGARSRGEDRRHRARRARADHDDAARGAWW